MTRETTITLKLDNRGGAKSGWPDWALEVLLRRAIQWDALVPDRAAELPPVITVRFCCTPRRMAAHGSSLSYRPLVKMFLHRHYQRRIGRSLLIGRRPLWPLCWRDRRVPEMHAVADARELRSRIEALVFLLGHELRHQTDSQYRGCTPRRRDPDGGKHFALMEARCDVAGYFAVESYRRDRVAILSELRIAGRDWRRRERLRRAQESEARLMRTSSAGSILDWRRRLGEAQAEAARGD